MSVSIEHYFFIGTEAELIKLFPIIIECQNQGDICHIIASGQNNLTGSRIMQAFKQNGQFCELSKEDQISKSARGLFKWFISTKYTARSKICACFLKERLRGSNLIVHGDTISTVMGALLGKELGMCVCHVEAGLRSYHLLDPFPEEIDRLIVSRIARVHFAPGALPSSNLKRAKGRVVDTTYNTILDALAFSEKIPIDTPFVKDLLHQDYFVFVMHRQENLMRKDFVSSVVSQIVRLAEKKGCVLILHKITEKVFREMGILEELVRNPRFILFPRVDYFDFCKILDHACFVITDGGSNQEELHLLGKPCLILRKSSERQDGIEKNCILFDGNIESIIRFGENYRLFVQPKVKPTVFPSKMIADYLGKKR